MNNRLAILEHNIDPRMLDLIAIEKALGQKSFKDFFKLAWSYVDSAHYIDGWHIDCICEHLMYVYNREIRNIIFNIPPRHCKSTLISVCFPAWCWVNDPSLSFILSSYSSYLSTRDNVKCRRLLESNWFQNRWGLTEEDFENGDFHKGVMLLKDENQKTRYGTVAGGFKIATSVGGALTGEGCNFFISDDPHNVMEAESEVVRQSAIDWWTEGVSTRLNDPSRDCKIIIMQRVHENDLSGYCLSEECQEEYHHVCLPARFEHDHPHVFYYDIRLHDGELLWPERFNEESLNRIEGALGSYAAAGQLQQRPSPRGGGMFKEEWWKFCDIDEVSQGGVIACAWDLASTDSKTSDWTVRCKMKFTNNAFYILDIVRKRKDSGAVKGFVKTILERDDMDDVHVHSLPLDPGAAGKLVAADWSTEFRGFPVRFTPETGSKQTRAQGLANECEFGNVYIVRGHWNDSFIHELSVFDQGTYDDQVDAASRAYHELVRIAKKNSASFKVKPSSTPNPISHDPMQPKVDSFQNEQWIPQKENKKENKKESEENKRKSRSRKGMTPRFGGI